MKMYISHSLWKQKLKHQPYDDIIQGNQSIHVTDGVTVISLPASRHHKTSAAVNGLCQITHKLSLSHIICAKLCSTKIYHANSKSGVNFQVVLKHICTKWVCVQQYLPIVRNTTKSFVSNLYLKVVQKIETLLCRAVGTAPYQHG